MKLLRALGAGLLLTVALPSVADTTVRPSADTRRFEWVDAFNRHWAGQSGADGKQTQTTVSITFAPDHTAQVVDHGFIKRSVLNGDNYAATTTEWTHSWSGPWKEKSGTRTITLGLEAGKSACSVTESERRGAEQYAPKESKCDATPETLTLECVSSTVKTDTQPSVAAFICRRTAGQDPRTALPWVFAKSGCVQRAGQSYKACD